MYVRTWQVTEELSSNYEGLCRLKLSLTYREVLCITRNLEVLVAFHAHNFLVWIVLRK
jgi:hypothetical protein